MIIYQIDNIYYDHKAETTDVQNKKPHPLRKENPYL